MDVAILVTLVTAFALAVTAHVALCFAIVFRASWWRALLALLLPPVAPYFGYQAGLRWGPALWLGAVFLYAVALIAALSI